MHFFWTQTRSDKQGEMFRFIYYLHIAKIRFMYDILFNWTLFHLHSVPNTYILVYISILLLQPSSFSIPSTALSGNRYVKPYGTIDVTLQISRAKSGVVNGMSLFN